jgi:hypothetical protein
VIIDALAKIDPEYPTVGNEAQQALLASKERLEAEAPDGIAADPAAARLVAGQA